MNNTFLYRDRNWLFEQMIVFGKTEKQLSQEFGWTKRVIEKWAQIYGFGDNNFKNLKTINSIQESLIKGSLLGDGHITEEGIFIVSHCEAQKDYLFWKYNLLKDCCKKEPTYYPSTIKTIKNQKCCIQPAYRLNTRKIIQIKNLKYLTKIDIIKNLNDFEFAIWMLDDGYRDKWSWDLCLGNLSEEEKLEVEKFLLQKNLSFVYRKDKRYIRFHNQATRVIDEIILNNIPNDLDIINNKIRKGGDQQNG